MRCVELHLEGQPAGWNGRRRVIVVRETETFVLLLETACGRQRRFKRSVFEAANPKPIPKDDAAIRARLTELEGKDYRSYQNYSTKRAITQSDEFRAVSAYVKANVSIRSNQVRQQPWERKR